MDSENTELNEMEILEKNIIDSYNNILKKLVAEGDMEELERIITDDSYRRSVMKK